MRKKTKAEAEVVDAEVVSTAIVKSDPMPTPPAKEEWVWDKKKRVAFRMAMEGAGPVDIAKKIGVLSNEPFTRLISELKEISKMLTGLARSIRRPN